MSEEILKALMQLFAIIAKQDSEEFEGERLYVENFLKKQVQPKDVDLYISLFDEKIQEARKKSSRRANRKLTSVTDSVSVLKICMRINKTLDHRQKVISTIQLLEMVSLRKMGKQRMDIILTVADVFNIDLKEFDKFNQLIFPQDDTFEEDVDFLIIDDKHSERPNHIRQKGLNGRIVILRNISSELFIVRYTGSHDLILNGLPFETGSCAVFNPGSSIKTPVGKPIYFSDVFEHFSQGADKMAISFIADKISYKFDKGNFGIQNLSIHEQQNSLIAIMGASGSGKSTLLNIMAGNYRPHSGSIRINGIDLYDNPDELEGVIGLIPQDDLLIENLSVFENLFFNARFCFKNKSKEEITELVNETLKSLDLYQIKDLAVGNSLNKLISGGQRKRLNIALELIREPSILFVDEPTSGLSSLDSENVMDLLRRLSLTGKLIFVVIH
ncbi:MAG: ABC transporter, partial [Bacteroidetes bacterium]